MPDPCVYMVFWAPIIVESACLVSVYLTASNSEDE